MPESSLTLYKLIVLYMLDRVDFPLTKTQICDFILDRGYTNFITLQQAISELIDAGMIHAQTMRNRTHISLTKDGQDALHYFENRISDAIKQDIKTFLTENKLKLRNEVSILADYYKSTSGEYEAKLIAKDKDVTLVDLTLSVPIEETAATICDNWQKKNQDIYQYLISQLF
ncbi:MAG: DUF4364 family protein [Lachnospiraceae bacterium]|nr:DUF4364 family protein [Lachnospiraceae bacterium]